MRELPDLFFRVWLEEYNVNALPNLVVNQLAFDIL